MKTGVAGSAKAGPSYRVRFSVIFVIEDPFYQQVVETIHAEAAIRSSAKETSEGVFVIRCQRDNPIEGISQLKNIWNRCRPKDSDDSYITFDISGFTKIYLLELLYFLVAEQKSGNYRVLYTPRKAIRQPSYARGGADFYGA